jgi:hypothetical protein
MSENTTKKEVNERLDYLFGKEKNKKIEEAEKKEAIDKFLGITEEKVNKEIDNIDKQKYAGKN